MEILDLPATLLFIIALILLVPVLVLLVEILASFLPRRDKSHTKSHSHSSPPPFTVVVPAHNEQTVIVETLSNILAQLSDRDRLVVIADNCTDETGKRAEKTGAEVIYRKDPTRRGKGYALDFGINHLKADPPSVMIIMDADCLIEHGGLAKIASICAKQQRPVQALYEMLPPSKQHSSYLKFATLAWRLKNHLRPLGLYRLGLPCQLMGTGMAFPWSIMSKVDLASAEVVEDLVLGLNLASDGHAPLFCPTVKVTSRFPENATGQQTQRTRWETGHLNTIARILPAHVLKAIKLGNHKSLFMALDAAVPPLAFLSLALSAILSLAIILALLGGPLSPLLLTLVAIALLCASILLVWWQVGKDIISFIQLGLAPFYALSKIALYGRILVGRQIEWIRSKRD